MNSSGTRRVQAAVRILSALAVLFLQSTFAFEPGIEPACLCQSAQAIPSVQALFPLPALSAAIAMIAARTGFTGPFSGAGGLLNSIFPGASTVGQRRRVSRITQEYRDSRRAKDQEAGHVGAPGTSPARAAGMLHIAPDIGDGVCPGENT